MQAEVQVEVQVEVQAEVQVEVGHLVEAHYGQDKDELWWPATVTKVRRPAHRPAHHPADRPAHDTVHHRVRCMRLSALQRQAAVGCGRHNG